MDSKEIKFTDLTENDAGKIYLVLIDDDSPRKVFVRYNGGNNFSYFTLDAKNEVQIKFPEQFAADPNTVSFVKMNLPQEIINRFIKHGVYYGGKNKKTKNHNNRRNKRRTTRRNNKNKKRTHKKKY
jgi:hypothetical protein